MMFYKRFLRLLLLSVLVCYAGRGAYVEAYRIQYKTPLVKTEGNVLGSRDEVEYTYVVRARPTDMPAPTDPVTMLPASTATPTPSPSPTPVPQADWIGDLLTMLNTTNSGSSKDKGSPQIK
jgi:hypothetical protein